MPASKAHKTPIKLRNISTKKRIPTQLRVSSQARPPPNPPLFRPPHALAQEAFTTDALPPARYVNRRALSTSRIAPTPMTCVSRNTASRCPPSASVVIRQTAKKLPRRAGKTKRSAQKSDHTPEKRTPRGRAHNSGEGSFPGEQGQPNPDSKPTRHGNALNRTTHPTRKCAGLPGQAPPFPLCSTF